ncbi:hypothetical protein [Vibrio sp. ABG19]|uniref:hypothetical protein n=1 Tax=Vibrio sp. ABG19 TaxID=2817385 RepID=UPI00249F81D0|nr:hypothetical protein [Vibrio sp. ABG19]WGY45935.1 hypothetical protein J0X00_05950 [Vibrio sp. ABG19]
MSALGRLINATMDAINRKRAKDAANNPADTIANGGRVQHSSKSYADLADQSERD